MRAVVTGGASGIGRAVAHRLAADAAARGDRARLLLVDVAPLDDAVRDVDADVTGLAVDLSTTDCGDIVAAAARARLGGLDALVSNAGVVGTSALAELSLDEYERTFAVNTRATWLLAKACHGMLADGGGALVATASIASVTPAPPMGAYASSKAALAMLVAQLAYEWGPDGIRCNCVSPGLTHTGMTDGTYSDPELRAERAAQVPLRRVGEADDVAAMIAFLAGPDAAYVTGENILVDGGLGTVLLPAVRGLTPP